MLNEQTLSIRAYAVVLLALLLLTLLTVGVSFMPLEGEWHVVAGLTIAVVKGALVALFFMHVIHSPRLTWIVIAVAVFWMLIMFALTFSDYLTRGGMSSPPVH